MRIIPLALLLLSACGDSVTWGPEGQRWPSIPVRVALDPEAIEHRQALDDAIAYWERETGLDLFVRVDGPAGITVAIGSVSGSLVGKCTHSPGHALVELIGPLDGLAARVVLQHELGHALGLGHDRAPASIMFGELDVGLMTGEELPMFVVTGADRDALRAAYR
jgi:hypothetical protein